MKNRRALLLSMTSCLVALAVLAAPVIAEELLGVITKVDVAGKKLTVLNKADDKDVEITITDNTEYITKDGAVKIDNERLEKIDKQVKKSIENGKKGVPTKIEHEKGVAVKIQPAFGKKKAAN